jgi:two-component system, NarL family, sensor histidine kinase DesK
VVGDPGCARTGPAASKWPLGSRSRGASAGFMTIWLVFIALPIVTAATDKDDALARVLSLLGGVAFSTLYVALIVVAQRLRRGGSIALLVAMLALAAALTLFNHSGWGYLFCYCAACSALLRGWPVALAGVVVSTLLAAGAPALAGASGGTAFGLASSAAGVGLLMLLIKDLGQRNDELVQARAELARLAVSQERERFARDLHDLLGHSLSVIAIKAELAGRLLPAQAERAAAEIADVEQVARQALGEVRETVSGYRRPTLEGELAGARMALAAAGIETEVAGAEVSLAEEVEAVLAWAVREGATNVIRHSAARHCTLRVSAAAGAAEVEVLDDGPDAAGATGAAGDAGAAAASNGGGGGHGLAGLRERVSAIDGTVSAGPRAGGGYRLAVSVPSGTSG